MPSISDLAARHRRRRIAAMHDTPDPDRRVIAPQTAAPRPTLASPTFLEQQACNKRAELIRAFRAKHGRNPTGHELGLRPKIHPTSAAILGAEQTPDAAAEQVVCDNRAARIRAAKAKAGRPLTHDELVKIGVDYAE